MSQWGTSNEYLQHMFLWRNKKNINTIVLKKASYHWFWIYFSAFCILFDLHLFGFVCFLFLLVSGKSCGLRLWPSPLPGFFSCPFCLISHTVLLMNIHIFLVKNKAIFCYSFYCWNPETKKPMHRELGFIRMKPGTKEVAFMIAQNSGTSLCF